jgi:signal transduction histidine kinase
LNEGIRSTALSQFREIKEAVREMSHRINKSWIERFTLEESIRGLCADILKMTNLNVKLFAPEIYPVMQKEVKVHVFRIIQELLSNAVKYAIKAEVILDISFNNNILLLKYSDNGPGFDKENVFKKGIGLNNLQERVSLLNGKIEIDADPGYGTYFEIRIPMHGN